MSETPGLARAMDDLVAGLVPGPPPTATLLKRRGYDVRRRLRGTGAAIVVVVAALVAAAVVALPRAIHRATPPGSPQVLHGWQRLPDSGLSPRWDVLGAWVDDRAVFVGGTSSDLASTVQGPTLRDGAAWDPRTGSWRGITPAPVPIRAEYDAAAVVGSRLIVADGDTWLSYSPSDDVWSRLPAPPHRVFQPALTGLAGRLYAVSPPDAGRTSVVQVLDLATETWSVLPREPFRPAIDDPEPVALPDGVVVLGDDQTERESATRSDQPLRVYADVWDGHAWRRIRSARVLDYGVHWTGRRIVSTSPGINFGAVPGYRAAGLDLTTGRWTRLPATPGRHLERWDGLFCFAGRPASALPGPTSVYDGFLWDDRDRHWTRLQAPSPAAESGATAVCTPSGVVVLGGWRDRPTAHPTLGSYPVTPVSQAWLFPGD